MTKCRGCWEGEVPDIQGEDWDDLWDHPFKHLVSARDRLIHLKFLHRIYFTPARLSVIYPSVMADCWRCSFSPADARHVFWECPQIKIFWSGVIACIEEILMVPIPLSIRICAHRTLLNILLFYGRKSILLKWRSSAPPSLSFWKALVNSMMPYYKATYVSRGCMKKFDKVWQAWLTLR